MADELARLDMNTAPTVTAILVGYDGPPATLARAVESLRRQTYAVTQIVCVDQSVDGRFHGSPELGDGIEFVRIEENLGYPSACNVAARRASGDYLLFINPDATADAACVDELSGALTRNPGAAIAGAQVLLPGGERVNAGDNVLHLSGLSWAGRFGLPAEHGPPRRAAVVSGAALMVRREAFEAIGGYTEGFFMYYDDVDLAWRASLEGWEVVFCPDAVVTHEYTFEKGDYKWRYLERNRWWCLLTLLELRTLVLLTPLLIAVEGAIWARAAAEGWTRAKRDGWRLLWSDRRALCAQRRRIQGSRRVGDRTMVRLMAAEVDSPFLSTGLVRHARPFLRAYRRIVIALIAARASEATDDMRR